MSYGAILFQPWIVSLTQKDRLKVFKHICKDEKSEIKVGKICITTHSSVELLCAIAAY